MNMHIWNKMYLRGNTTKNMRKFWHILSVDIVATDKKIYGQACLLLPFYFHVNGIVTNTTSRNDI
jgi:hypothetical protein